MSASKNLSYEQLAMYMTPEEIKDKYSVKDFEFHDHEISERELYNRKQAESKKLNIEGWPKRRGQESLHSSIKKQGVQEPVHLDFENKEIVDGHHRIASAPEKSLIPVEYVN